MIAFRMGSIAAVLVACLLAPRLLDADPSPSSGSPNLSPEPCEHVGEPADGDRLANVEVADPVSWHRRARCDGQVVACPHGLCYGWLEVRFSISESGEVGAPSAVSSCPHDQLDRASARALQTWRYNPRIRAGQRYRVPAACVRLVYVLGEGT